MYNDHALRPDELDYLHGECHLFAIAMHRLTGLPLRATLDVDLWTEKIVLVHAYVMDGGDCIDIRGRFDIVSVEQEFDVTDPWESAISEDELMLLGNGRPDVDENSAAYKKALKYAIAVAAKLQLVDVGIASPTP